MAENGNQVQVEISARAEAFIQQMNQAQAAFREFASAAQQSLGGEVPAAAKKAHKETGTLFDTLKHESREMRQHGRVLNFYARELGALSPVAKDATSALLGMGVGLASGMWMMAAVEGIKLVIDHFKEMKEESKKAAETAAKAWEQAFARIEAARKSMTVGAVEEGKAQVGMAKTEMELAEDRVRAARANLDEAMRNQGSAVGYGDDQSTARASANADVAAAQAAYDAAEEDYERRKRFAEGLEVNLGEVETQGALKRANERRTIEAQNASDRLKIEAEYQNKVDELKANKKLDPEERLGELENAKIARDQKLRALSEKSEVEEIAASIAAREVGANEIEKIYLESAKKLLEIRKTSVNKSAEQIAQEVADVQAGEDRKLEIFRNTVLQEAANKRKLTGGFEGDVQQVENPEEDAELKAAETASAERTKVFLEEQRYLNALREAEGNYALAAEIARIYKERDEKIKALKDIDDAQRAYHQQAHPGEEYTPSDVVTQGLEAANAAANQGVNKAKADANVVGKAWQEASKNIAGNFASAMGAVAAGSGTMRQALGALLGDIVKGFAEMAMKAISNNALVAGSGAAASQAGVPVVGPALAAAAMGAMVALVGGLTSNIAHASGGWDLPAGGPFPSMLHSREMVLPANLADKVRNMTDGGGGNVQVALNITAFDGHDVYRTLRANEGQVVRALTDAVRRGRL